MGESVEQNIGHICTALQCEKGHADARAMRWMPTCDQRIDYSFADLDRASNRFASVLVETGFAPGDILFTFLPKMPEQFFCFLGALKARAVCGTLFSNFGDEALFDRLSDSRAKGIVTRKGLLRKVARIRGRLPELRHIFLVDGDDSPSEGVVGLSRAMSAASEEFTALPVSSDTPSVLHYTSGSTGRPKGVVHRHGSVLSQIATTRDVLGLRLGDIFWCTADQGWVTGTSYGIIGPWSLGVTQVHYGGSYDAGKWFEILGREHVTVWYTAPTALRMIYREDESVYSGVDLSQLRAIFSVGEPLSAQIIHWARRALRHEVFDTWFQTETGAIMISNRPGLEVRPGSMGKPTEGVEAEILSADGRVLPVGARGNLCLKPGWPSMFAAYLNHDDAYRAKFRHGYYHTGDTAYRDRDGYFWFTGRSDDVINTAGHLVSPFEVESALLELDEVAESAVFGAPDDLLFEKVVAFVRLREGCAASPETELKIRIHVSNHASSVATPQAVVFCDSIPKTRSGKIMRRVLKARYLGEDPGDLSTLETEP